MMPWLKVSFTIQMLIGALLGLFFGLFLGSKCQFLAPWSDAYIMILKITAIPYLFLAVMHGVGQLTGKQGLEILKKGIFFITLAWAINIILIFLTAWVFPTAENIGPSQTTTYASQGMNFAEILIPDNIFSALANNTVPAVVVFSLLVGLALMQVQGKGQIITLLDTLVEVLTLMTKWISRIAPFGTFIILAYQVGTADLATIQKLSSYIFLYIAGMCIVTFWIFPRLISLFTSFSAWSWIRGLSPILILAFTTNLVIVTIPYIVALVQRETEILCPKDEKAQGQIQGTVSVIFNLPLGSLFLSVFVLFIAHIEQVRLGLWGRVELLLSTFLSSLGAIGLGSWINNMSFILDTLSLPANSINLFLATIPFTAGVQSMVSATEITALALLTTFACRKILSWKKKKWITSLSITVIPVALLFIGLKYYSPFPSLKSSKPLYQIAPATEALPLEREPTQN